MSADNIVLIVRDGHGYKAYDCSFSAVTCEDWWNYTDHNGNLSRHKAATRGARDWCHKYGYYLKGCDADVAEACEMKAKRDFRESDSVLEYGTEIFR
jgi:hypothetical protein